MTSTEQREKPLPPSESTPSTRRPRPYRQGPRRPRPAARRRRAPKLDLSVTQLVATGLAAITATFAASYLGVTGTVIGAALASVLTSAGKEVYSQSLRRTGNRVREVVPVTRVLPRAHDHAGKDTASIWIVEVDAAEAARDTDPDAVPELPADRPRGGARDDQAVKWRRIALSAVAVFAGVLAVITAVEIIGGRPLSDLLRGDSGSGTSLFGNTQITTRTRTVPPVAPTTTVTVTPKVVVTTPTVTQTAPTVTRTSSGSTSPSSPAPSTSSSTSPSGTPTTSGSTSP